MHKLYLSTNEGLFNTQWSHKHDYILEFITTGFAYTGWSPVKTGLNFSVIFFNVLITWCAVGGGVGGGGGVD